MKFILILFLTLANVSFADEKIAHVIQNLQPKMQHKKADKYAKLIRKHSKMQHIEWQIAVAIFQRESSFRLDAVEKNSKDFGKM